jgi:hypothetical protein
MKLPSMQFYPADWRKDPAIQSLSYHDRGVWFEMLCFMHESSERGVLLLNGLPMKDEAIARLLGLDKQILTETLTNLIGTGAAKVRESDGAIYSSRMVKDEYLLQIRREAGKKGGNPNLIKQNTTTEDNLIPTPSSSSSDISNPVSKKVAAAPVVVIPEALATDAFRASWDAYLAYRREMRFKSLKPQSQVTLLNEMAAWGEKTAIEAINTSIRNGWQGVFEPRTQRNAVPASTNKPSKYANAW